MWLVIHPRVSLCACVRACVCVCVHVSIMNDIKLFLLAIAVLLLLTKTIIIGLLYSIRWKNVENDKLKLKY